MITIYSGSPGSGKSLHVAKSLYWDVRMGRPCICNFDINHEMFKKGTDSFTYVENDTLSPEYLIDYSQSHFENRPYREGEIRLYLDEIAIKLGAREWNAYDRKDWITFFQQHRKLGYDIILITQMDTMLDKQVRGLVEYEVKHRKVNNYGIFGGIVSLFCLGRPLCCGVRYWYPMKQRINAEFFLGMKRYYRLYDTYKIFS